MSSLNDHDSVKMKQITTTSVVSARSTVVGHMMTATTMSESGAEDVKTTVATTATTMLFTSDENMRKGMAHANTARTIDDISQRVSLLASLPLRLCAIIASMKVDHQVGVSAS
jgi:hypothetical protein